MKKQNVTEEQLEGLLWENAKKYTRGEINAREYKNTLSSHSEEMDLMRLFLIAFMLFVSVVSLIAGIISYTITKSLILLLISFGPATSSVIQIATYYFKKRKKH